MDYRPSKMGHVLIDLYTGKLPFVIQGGFDFCDVRDVASAIANALVSGRPGENYLLGGTWHSLWELVEIISLVTGKTGKTISLPPVLGWMGLPVVQVLSWIKKSEPIYTREALTAIVRGNKMICSQKAKQELQYHCRPLEETVRDTLQWFRQNGYLVKSI
jgi:dihydroflavonol-4-reductase